MFNEKRQCRGNAEEMQRQTRGRGEEEEEAGEKTYRQSRHVPD
jgi:hypothetical protein